MKELGSLIMKMGFSWFSKSNCFKWEKHANKFCSSRKLTALFNVPFFLFQIFNNIILKNQRGRFISKLSGFQWFNLEQNFFPDIKRIQYFFQKVKERQHCTLGIWYFKVLFVLLLTPHFIWRNMVCYVLKLPRPKHQQNI